MTRIKDPKQVASTIRQILLILMRSSNVCFMAGHGEPEGRREGGCRAPYSGSVFDADALAACVRVSKISVISLKCASFLRTVDYSGEAPPPMNERAHAFIFVSI